MACIKFPQFINSNCMLGNARNIVDSNVTKKNNNPWSKKEV